MNNLFASSARFVGLSALVATLSFTTALAGSKPTDDKATEKAAVQVTAFSTNDAKIWVNVQKEAPVGATLFLRDQNGNALYTHGIGKKQKTSATRLDVSALEDGEYMLQVVSKGGTITKKFELRTPQTSVQRQLEIQ